MTLWCHSARGEEVPAAARMLSCGALDRALDSECYGKRLMAEDELETDNNSGQGRRAAVGRAAT